MHLHCALINKLFSICHPYLHPPCSPQWGAADAEIKLMRTRSLKVLTLKPGVGQYIAMHATLTARDFFRADF